MYDFNGTKVETNEADKILESFKARYLDESYPERILDAGCRLGLNRSGFPKPCPAHWCAKR